MGIFSEEELAADALQEGDTPPEPKADELPEAQQPDPEAADKQPRDETGKFAAKEGEDDGKREDKGGQVPQGALHAERERRKTAEAEARKFREQLDAIAQMRQQVASRQPEALPAQDDPAQVEHLRQRLAQLEQGQTRITQERDNQRLDQAESQQLQAAIASSESEFRAAQPDYDDAVQYLISARHNELVKRHGLDPVSANLAIAEETQEVVRSAIRQGMSPAEMAYGIAQDRGYRPAQQQQAAPAQGGAQRTMDAIAAAKAGSRSLGQASGTTPQVVNAETIASMTDDEFAVIYSTPEGRKMIDAL